MHTFVHTSIIEFCVYQCQYSWNFHYHYIGSSYIKLFYTDLYLTKNAQGLSIIVVWILTAGGSIDWITLELPPSCKPYNNLTMITENPQSYICQQNCLWILGNELENCLHCNYRWHLGKEAQSLQNIHLIFILKLKKSETVVTRWQWWFEHMIGWKQRAASC